jgi:hypothetical protein
VGAGFATASRETDPERAPEMERADRRRHRRGARRQPETKHTLRTGIYAKAKIIDKSALASKVISPQKGTQNTKRIACAFCASLWRNHLSANIRGLDRSELLFRIVQNCRINASGCCDAPGRRIGCFLKHVSSVSARPFPPNFVSGCGVVESFPPGKVRFASKASVHRLNYISRICEQTDLTRLRQRFKSNRRRNDLRLLIRRHTEIFPNGAPDSLISQQGHRSRATRRLSIAQARTVAKDRHVFEGRILFLFVHHS